jgi:hypothetical protein
MTLEEQQLYWMDKAREYADKGYTESTHEYIMQWQKDALYVAYLKGVEEALGIRIIS